MKNETVLEQRRRKPTWINYKVLYYEKDASRGLLEVGIPNQQLSGWHYLCVNWASSAGNGCTYRPPLINYPLARMKLNGVKYHPQAYVLCLWSPLVSYFEDCEVFVRQSLVGRNRSAEVGSQRYKFPAFSCVLSPACTKWTALCLSCNTVNHPCCQDWDLPETSEPK